MNFQRSKLHHYKGYFLHATATAKYLCSATAFAVGRIYCTATVTPIRGDYRFAVAFAVNPSPHCAAPMQLQ
jgi:hypothetical protein